MRHQVCWANVTAVLFGLGVAAPAAAAAAAPMRVAILEFTNTSTAKDLEGVGKGLQAMVTTDLAQVGSIELVERSRLSDLVAELRLGKSGLVDPKSAARLGKLAGATHLVGGAVTVVGGQMRIDCRFFAVGSGAITVADSIAGDKDAFFELEKALVRRVVERVGARPAARERAAMARVQTADFEAFRLYGVGLAREDERRLPEALVALREAARRDDGFQLAIAETERVEGLIGLAGGAPPAPPRSGPSLARGSALGGCCQPMAAPLVCGLIGPSAGAPNAPPGDGPSLPAPSSPAAAAEGPPTSGGPRARGVVAELHLDVAAGASQSPGLSSPAALRAGLFGGYKLDRIIIGLGVDFSRDSRAGQADTAGTPGPGTSTTTILLSPGARVALLGSADRRVELFGELDLGLGHTFRDTPANQDESNFRLVYSLGPGLLFWLHPQLGLAVLGGLRGDFNFSSTTTTVQGMKRSSDTSSAVTGIFGALQILGVY